MKTLLWREWRWNRLILIAGLVFFLIPYLTSTVAVLWPRKLSLRSFEIANLYILAAILSLAGSQLTLVCLGGHAIAGERLDRTAEFLASMPVSTWDRILAKWALSALFAFAVFTLNWFVVWILLDFLPSSLCEETNYVLTFTFIVAGGFLMFGAAWCVSSFQSRPTFAVCMGVMALFPVLLGLLVMDSLFEVGQEAANKLFEVGFPFTCLLWGATGLWLGAWHFANRIEP